MILSVCNDYLSNLQSLKTKGNLKFARRPWNLKIWNSTLITGIWKTAEQIHSSRKKIRLKTNAVFPLKEVFLECLSSASEASRGHENSMWPCQGKSFKGQAGKWMVIQKRNQVALSKHYKWKQRETKKVKPTKRIVQFALLHESKQEMLCKRRMNAVELYFPTPCGFGFGWAAQFSYFLDG